MALADLANDPFGGLGSPGFGLIPVANLDEIRLAQDIASLQREVVGGLTESNPWAVVRILTDIVATVASRSGDPSNYFPASNAERAAFAADRFPALVLDLAGLVGLPAELTLENLRRYSRKETVSFTRPAPTPETVASITNRGSDMDLLSQLQTFSGAPPIPLNTPVFGAGGDGSVVGADTGGGFLDGLLGAVLPVIQTLSQAGVIRGSVGQAFAPMGALNAAMTTMPVAAGMPSGTAAPTGMIGAQTYDMALMGQCATPVNPNGTANPLYGLCRAAFEAANGPRPGGGVMEAGVMNPAMVKKAVDVLTTIAVGAMSGFIGDQASDALQMPSGGAAGACCAPRGKARAISSPMVQGCCGPKLAKTLYSAAPDGTLHVYVDTGEVKFGSNSIGKMLAAKTGRRRRRGGR